ncbi:ferritin-like domain-containing protein [Anoxybacillus caldiproteolyticus]|nr:ferritin-like domain-containing protein [Anoxybacillus caldiproteolyticus]
MYGYNPYSTYYSVQQNSFLERNHGGKSQRVFRAILDAIKSEAAAIDFYTRLIRLAPNAQHQNDIRHALEDEKIHLKQFTELYINLTGQQPVYNVEKTTFHSYEEGLKIAYKDELEAYEEYRNSYLLTQDPLIRDVFFKAFTDEIEHAIRFGFLILKPH